jgi:hypothetical protein
MAIMMALRHKQGNIGYLDLTPETRLQIYRHSLIDQCHSAIPILRVIPCTSNPHRLAISPRSLSAQLLRTCHQVLHEAYPVLYIENDFTLYIDNNIVGPKAIPLTLTSGNFRTLQRIAMGIQPVRLLKADLQDILPSFPCLKILGIDGNLLRTIDFCRPLERESNTAMQRCIDQSIGLLLSAFGGMELGRKFIIQQTSLAVEYTFGIAVDLILPATGRVVKGIPHVGFMQQQNIKGADNKISGIRSTCVR